jgi:2-oxoglutarate ferredoxin oxidoreductase subunit alpha
MNAGQMLHDVRAAVAGRAPVDFYGRTGGMIPLPDEISQQIDRLMSLPASQPSPVQPGNGYHRNAAATAVAGRARA